MKHEEPPGLAITFAPSLDPPQLIVRIRTKEGATEHVLPAHASGDVVVSPSSGFVRFYGEAVPFPQSDRKTHVTIDFDLERAPAEGVASSFGIGKHLELDIAPSELSKGVWMSGSVFTARFDAYEGKDDFSWIGYSAFDPRWVSAEIATLRTAVSQYFGDGHPPPMSMLFTMDRRDSVEASPISIYPRWHGMFAIVDLDAPWSISARMQVALALVSRFITKNPGYARYAAREILLASGTMTPAEYEAEINGEIAATLFADKNPAAAAIARDALDCNRKDPRTMQQMLRSYVATGKMEALSGEPSFGKCFARASTTFEELDLGFDEEKTRAERKLSGVHGPALKAGLREGEPLVSIHWDEGRPDRPVRVTVTRDGVQGQVTYRPVGRTKTAQGWRVAAGIDPSSCAR